MYNYQCLIIILTMLLKCLATNLDRRIDSDSPDYEQFYVQLDAEYAHALFVTSAAPENYAHVTSDPEWVKQYDEETLSGSLPSTEAESPVKTESFADTAQRLNCDNPWFWNTFRCVWIDLRANKSSKRTRKNAKVAGIIIGIFSLLIGLPLCWLCVVALYFRSRVNKYAKLMDRYMTEYMPGSIILPNGEVKYYDPTPEEEEAFEDLIHVISSAV